MWCGMGVWWCVIVCALCVMVVVCVSVVCGGVCWCVVRCGVWRWCVVVDDSGVHYRCDADVAYDVSLAGSLFCP